MSYFWWYDVVHVEWCRWITICNNFWILNNGHLQWERILFKQIIGDHMPIANDIFAKEMELITYYIASISDANSINFLGNYYQLCYITLNCSRCVHPVWKRKMRLRNVKYNNNNNKSFRFVNVSQLHSQTDRGVDGDRCDTKNLLW